MSVVEEELEVLKVILGDKLTGCVCREGVHRLDIRLDPETAEVDEEQFVYIDVVITVNSEQYPDVPPVVEFRKFRGLKEPHLTALRQEVQEMVEALLGSEMLYSIISGIREKLTELNRPHEDCAICRQSFQDGVGERRVRTGCFHYFHLPCVARWLQSVEEQRAGVCREAERNRVDPRPAEQWRYECPVCREDLPQPQHRAWLQAAAGGREGRESKVKVVISKEMRQWQRRMAALKKHQEEKGGIIDIKKQQQLLLLDPT